MQSSGDTYRKKEELNWLERVGEGFLLEAET